MADIEKIKKLIRLTASDNDHEALLALRNAQRLAKGDLLSFMGEDQTRHTPRTTKVRRETKDDDELEQGRRFLELLRRIRMKDATIASLEREIAKLKAMLAERNETLHDRILR